MNKLYKHTQIGFVIITLIVLIIFYLISLSMFTEENIGLEFMIPLFIVILMIFGTLSVELTELSLEIKFGIGLIKKSFLREEIESCTIVKTKWYNGWGIRLTTHGVLYSVSGFDAVEIKLKNGKHYRIGTDEPQELNRAINDWIY